MLTYINFVMHVSTPSIKRKRERKRARAKSMDRRGMLSENEKNFPGCPQPRKEKEGKTYHKKPIGWLAQSKKRGAKKDPLAVEDEALPMWKKPLPVKRCALWVTRTSPARSY